MNDDSSDPDEDEDSLSADECEDDNDEPVDDHLGAPPEAHRLIAKPAEPCVEVNETPVEFNMETTTAGIEGVDEFEIEGVMPEGVEYSMNERSAPRTIEQDLRPRHTRHFLALVCYSGRSGRTPRHSTNEHASRTEGSWTSRNQCSSQGNAATA